MKEINAILDKTVAALQTIAGAEAVVLGGSRARGTHNEDSDIDIGIYYNGDSNFGSSLFQVGKAKSRPAASK